LIRERKRSDQFDLTHEYLAGMLGVRRVGITKSAGALLQLKLIDYSRGKIRIPEPRGLKAASCRCYRIINDQYGRAQSWSY
jgi:hypothetical protein